MSNLERQFETRRLQLMADLPEPKHNYRFSASRKWAFDFAWPSMMVAVEIEGGHWTHGRHTRGQGYHDDCTKYNAALEQGWRVLRYTADHLHNDPLSMFDQIRKIIEESREQRRIALGWSPGYFKATAGCLADEPLGGI